jgi:uncharacterized protein YegP (UPF0339 family)
MKFKIRQGGDGLWYWRLRARNGKTIADGSEGYRSRRNCRDAAKRVKDGAGGAELPA